MRRYISANTFSRFCLYGLTSLVFLAGCSNEKTTTHNFNPPYSPEEALSTFEIADGFRIEPFAAEPLIADPVAMEIDEAGRIYIVEMHGYPLDKSGSGKIKLLEDTDKDGKPDKSTVFAEGLRLPNGIMRWRNGILVTDAPDVLYLEDSNNDGKADSRKVILTGFALSNPQHNLNTPVYGLDNWIYLAHESAVTTKLFPKEFGDEGKVITFLDKPGAPTLPVNAAGRNVRFNPYTYQLEILSGKSQFGQTFDTWGNHFLVSNAHHLFQEMLPARYILRNPDLVVSDATQSIPDHGAAAEVFPITQNPQHQLLTDVGVMTSACGITSYLGGAFPESFNEAILVAEPVHNIVHVDKLKSKGASFSSSRMYPDKEFLASTDSWFRPVNFYTGPDGALYVLDYYRQIIEHPEWMSEEINTSGALYNGTDKGRIYRIVPNTFSSPTQTKLLADASISELVVALESKNIWWRKTAQRLLVDKKASESVLPLTNLVKESDFAPARLHALWTLEGIGSLDTSLIIQALKDPVAGVRENAIKLAEIHLKEYPSLSTSLLALSQDEHAKVRYQLVCTVGEISGPSVNSIRQHILFTDIEDTWVHLAVLSSPGSNPLTWVEQLIKEAKQTEGKQLFLQQACAMIGKRNQEEEISKVARLALSNSKAWWCAISLKGLAQGMQGRTFVGQTLLAEREKMIENFFDYPADVREAGLKILQIAGIPRSSTSQQALKKAKSIALDTQAKDVLRKDAITLLTFTDAKAHAKELESLIDPSQPALVQKAVMQALQRSEESNVGDFLLAKWNKLTPEIREEGIDVFMQSPERMRQLLDGIEKGIIQSSAVGWRRSVRLMNHEDRSIRSQARKLLDEKPGTREEVVKKYKNALTLTADSEKGKLVFTQVCSACHTIGGTMGNSFGPDLATLKNRKPEFIMQDILIPGRSIADGYEWWEVKEKDGKVYSGIISNETSETITLRQIGGQQQTISRSRITSLQTNEVSAMPTGLEKHINQQQMADLLAFIKQNRVHLSKLGDNKHE